MIFSKIHKFMLTLLSSLGLSVFPVKCMFWRAWFLALGPVRLLRFAYTKAKD